MERVRTIIVGGGQAGLSTSYFLSQQGHEHVILEQATQVANPWRSDRWDSFTLLTPNWASQLPGLPPHADRDGFLSKHEIIGMFEHYLQAFHMPVQFNTRVSSVNHADHGFQVITTAGSYRADNVVIATGLFQRPRFPAISFKLPPTVFQAASGQYRNPDALPDGAVLIVGAGQSGCQIAEELHEHGRKVYLSVSGAPRAPRRYRGKDIFEWVAVNGFMDRTPNMLPSPRARFAPNPQVSGKDGGHDLNLHLFARNGMVLLGHLMDVQDNKLIFADDLKESLAKTDQLEAMLIKGVDAYIAQQGINAPVQQLPQLRDGYEVPLIRELDIQAAGISAVIWATGYDFDFSMVRMAKLDEFGYPVQQRGVTSVEGLYFIGLPWLHKYKSGLLLGIADDAEYLADHIAARG
ncbi:MAG: NAD(P)-binding domain-containing protein [Anaerolineae bacterium]|nr:NAD(P)-binding domain-containing protein [Anaerolineae bacterium]